MTWGFAPAQTKTFVAGVLHDEATTTGTLGELYDAYGPRLFRYALMILGEVPSAEDAVQEAFVHVASVLRGRRPPAVTYAYMATVVRNECFTTLRKRGRRREEPHLFIEREAPDATEEERMILNGALAALPAQQREVMHLKVFEGLTFQEIADRCGISINTAGSRYRYAAAALRRMLAPATRQP